jgi:hypothetical protein
MRAVFNDNVTRLLFVLLFLLLLLVSFICGFSCVLTVLHFFFFAAAVRKQPLVIHLYILCLSLPYKKTSHLVFAVSLKAVCPCLYMYFLFCLFALLLLRHSPEL